MRIVLLTAALVLLFPSHFRAAQLSDATGECLDCHGNIASGMVAAWRHSRHAKTSPQEAMKKTKLERRISASTVPKALAQNNVGCAECHTLNPEKHSDTFEHNGYQVHIVVTPEDCVTCHPVERKNYGKNLMSHAYGNLVNNTLYQDLVRTINGVQVFDAGQMELQNPSPETNADSCLSCHGTRIGVKGFETRETVIGEEMEFPVLSGWPNVGVGRINPDGSKGSCTSCHTSHRFSIEMARKPHTCSQCHKGPDVPIYKIYQVSKHGNIYASIGHKWNFEEVPWTVGKDFTAPTCAACHVSLVVTEEGDVVAERTHQMNNRLPWRIFGLIYSHAHPRSPDTSVIRNRAGLPLPTDLGGDPASNYLIDNQEQQTRRKTLQQVCLSCHTSQWVDGHWARFENTIKTTNEMTASTTKLILKAWEEEAAKGLAANDSIFNEAIEKKWAEQWLFFANSTRMSSAMLGTDYAVFDNGRWYMAKNIQEIYDWLKMMLAVGGEISPVAKPNKQ
ncbi:MAG: hydroxylamine oxidase [Deltaproteobacteria bacterium]|nr:MAG: hydroxylamine oxidase [Deltaproteobacteria bacterium]